MWSYGLEVWGSARPSNVDRIQVLQSKILRVLVNAPFYASNLTLHTDLIQALSTLTLPDNPPRRLKRHWHRDLLQ